jgi:hypothetical protein
MILSGYVQSREETQEILQHAYNDNTNSIKSLELNFLAWDEELRSAVVDLLQAQARPLESVIVHHSADGRTNNVWTNIKKLELLQAPLYDPLFFSSSLEDLSLHSVSLNVHVAAALGASLAELPNVKRLDLTESRFLDNGVDLLSQGLARNISLEYVCIAECNLMDEEVALIVSNLENHPSIRELEICFNKCRGDGVAGLVRLLETTKLEKLKMGFQAFGEAKQIHVSPLLNALSNNVFLKELELGGNSLRDDDVPNIVNMLCVNSTLEALDLAENRLSDHGISLLAHRLHDFKALRRLGLESNRFGEAGIGFLAQALELTLVVHDIEVDDELKKSDDWEKVAYYLDLNWGGRNLLQANNVAPSLWPLVLARASDCKESWMTRTPDAADIINCILRGPAILER